MRANIPKGPSMNEMLRQAQKMQEDMQAKQAELEEREYEVSGNLVVSPRSVIISSFL